MRNGRLSANRGFTYIGVLAILAVISIALGAVAQVWHTQMQRENEQELLFVGNQFRNAIGRYFAESKVFPTSLQALLGKEGDGRLTKRYLRKIYRDPITGSTEWGLVLANDGQIAGVYSLSDKTPVKQAQFAERDSNFEGKTKYSDWQFVYTPQKAKGTAPAAGGVTGVPVTNAGEPLNGTAVLSAPLTNSGATIDNAAPTSSATTTNNGTTLRTISRNRN